MGKMSDLLIDSSTSEEIKSMVDNARDQYNNGYIEFLEDQLEKAEDKISKLKATIRKKKYPGYCVECFKSLPEDRIICGKCQDECDGRWDHLRE